MGRQGFPAMALAFAIAAFPAGAQDLHALWDQQCGGCHGHAGPFAREHLGSVDGRLVRAGDGTDLEPYLRSHNGGYPPPVIAAMTDMLRAQAGTPDLFRSRCGECHGTAAQLVRETVVSQDGRLVGRFSRQDIGAFLRRHGGLEEDEAALMLTVLTRIEAEVHTPHR